MATINDHFIGDSGENNKFSSIQNWKFEEALAASIAITSVYLILVLKILPAYMKNRKPYNLKRTLLFYNIFQVASSLYAAIIYARYIMRHGIFMNQCPKDEELKSVINKISLYFIAKHIDLLDTVFFVLRKKDNQVTFLHVYHHAIMISWSWLYLMCYPSDQYFIGTVTNSFVHVLMYAYYAVAALGPAYAKYAWWKRHLTKIQLIQFIMVLWQIIQQRKYTSCPMPLHFHYFTVFIISFFLLLFSNFYWRSYLVAKKTNPITENRKHSS